jgi:hypothetical protein
MKRWFRNGDDYYIIHQEIKISSFVDQNGILNMGLVKYGKDCFFKVDHVLKTDSHFLFAETIQDADVIEEN